MDAQPRMLLSAGSTEYTVVVKAVFNGKRFHRVVDLREELWEIGDTHRRIYEKLEKMCYEHFGLSHPGATSAKSKTEATSMEFFLRKQLGLR